MGAIPEGDAGLGEEVRNRHEGRSDNAEGMLDAVHLEDLDESLFGGHAHGVCLPEIQAIVDEASLLA